MKDLITFAEFEGFKLTFVVGPDGKRWFIATEVCAILGLTNVGRVTKRLRPHERMLYQIRLASDNRLHDVTIISRAGLTKFLMWSRKSIAERFQDWLTDVVENIVETGAHVIRYVNFGLSEGR